MSAIIPIAIGDRFARWTVLDTMRNNETSNPRILCRCDCGTERLVSVHSLRHGMSSGCGPCARGRRAQVFPIGHRFGDWEVIGERERRRTNPRIPCRCLLCGVEKNVLIVCLTHGRTTKCDDCRAAHKYVEIEPGTRFGSKVAIDWREGDSIRVRCDCGHEQTMTRHAFQLGREHCHECASRESQGIDLGGGVLMVDLAEEIGVSRQRIHQLISRGETIETIRSGAYKRTPARTGPVRTRPRCAECDRPSYRPHAPECSQRKYRSHRSTEAA